MVIHQVHSRIVPRLVVSLHIVPPNYNTAKVVGPICDHVVSDDPDCQRTKFFPRLVTGEPLILLLCCSIIIDVVDAGLTIPAS
jgi:hypothetical protein